MIVATGPANSLTISYILKMLMSNGSPIISMGLRWIGAAVNPAKRVPSQAC